MVSAGGVVSGSTVITRSTDLTPRVFRTTYLTLNVPGTLPSGGTPYVSNAPPVNVTAGSGSV